MIRKNLLRILGFIVAIAWRPTLIYFLTKNEKGEKGDKKDKK